MIRIALAALSILSIAHAQLREVWATSFDYNGYTEFYATDGAVSSNGDIYLCGTNHSGAVSFIASFSAIGDQQWFSPFNFGSIEMIHSVLLLNDDQLYAAGAYGVQATGLDETFIAKLDPFGYINRFYSERTNNSSVHIEEFCDGQIALMAKGFGARRSLNILFSPTLSIHRRSVVEWPLGESILPGSGGKTAPCDRVYQSTSVLLSNDRSGGRFYALDDQLNELYRLNLTPGALDGGVTQGLTTLAPDKPVVGFYSYYGAGYRQHVRSIGPSGETLWQTDFESIYPEAVSMNLWNDPNGYILGGRFEVFGGPMTFLLDPNDGRFLEGLYWTMPPGFNSMNLYWTVWDERGARYRLGQAFNRRDTGQMRDIHFLILKLDRNFRPVWQRWIRYDDAILGWSTYWNGHLIIAGTNHPRPPLVKLKILPVFSEGDVNGDECIDDADLAKLLEGYGTTNPSLDLNADGIVDATDLKELLHNFGFGCEG